MTRLPPPLGEFELLILLAVLRVDAANGSRVRDELEARTSRRIARGAVYVTLDRLERKGLLVSRLAAEPGRSRPTRLYRVSAQGAHAARRSVADVVCLRRGIERLLPIEEPS